MAELEEDPDAFRLFIEAWLHGQRDDELRNLVVRASRHGGATLAAFGAVTTAEAGMSFPTSS